MLAGFARQFNLSSLPKAGYQFGLTSLLLLAGAGSVHDATALNETRTLSFHHTHSDEDLTVTFKRDGRYDEEALKQLNHYLRDWRSQEQTTMDRHLFDILWEVYRDVDGKKPIQIISSYRSPATNAMLRRRSSGVARFSQHMLGHAMDFFIPDVPLEQIRFAGLRLQRGGVGFYPTSGSPFVHLDTGSIRHWPRMTHDQLARVFPDGRTVHIPSDGTPLKGYELARADIEKRGNGDDASTVSKPSLFAALFGRKSNDEEDEGPAAPVAREKSAPAGRSSRPPNPPSRCRCRAQSRRPRPSNWPRPTCRSCSPENRNRRQPTRPRRNRRRRLTSSTPAASGAIRPRHRNRPRPRRSPPSHARQALASADPQPTASVPAAYQAMAYAPAATSPVDRANIVAASAPIPRSARPASAPRNSMAVTDLTTVVAKGAQGQGGVVATSTRISASRANDAWMRVMMLAPSASTSMSATVLGDADMTPDERAFRQAAGSHRDGLLGRSADGLELRSI